MEIAWVVFQLFIGNSDLVSFEPQMFWLKSDKPEKAILSASIPTYNLSFSSKSSNILDDMALNV